MNLHGIAGPYIAAVNPMLPGVVQISSGYTTNPDGVRVPQYRQPPSNVIAQVQALTAENLRFLEGLGVQGSTVSIYLNGELDGIVRVQNKGGDLVTIPQGRAAGVYLVTAVLEQWPDWVKVAATLQNDSKVGC